MPTQIAPNLFHDSGLTLEQIPATAIVAITRLRNEGWRLPFWLAYHRWLGVDHFIIVNNRSTDGTREALTNEPDVSLLDAPGPYQGPDGRHSWIENIFAAAPQRRWNLLVDGDELFVAAPWQKGGLRDLIAVLEADDVDVMSAILVDCYPEFLPYNARVVPNLPWQRAPWFDRGPYARWNSRKRRPKQIYHGVRQRIFWPNWYWQRNVPKAIRKIFAISSPPAIMKAPLFRRSLERGTQSHRSFQNASRHSNYISYVLHYKLDFDLTEKTNSAVVEGQYYNNSSEYRVYQQQLQEDSIALKCSRSRQFTGYDSLVDAELCHYRHRHKPLEEIIGTGGISADLAWREIKMFAGSSLADTVNVPDPNPKNELSPLPEGPNSTD